MVYRIKTHNILNGIVFSIAEYIIAALIVAPFAVYYVVFGRSFLAVVAIGIILNCLVIVAIGFQQYRRRENDLGIRHMFKKEIRERVGREHPSLGRDTLVLSITVLLPFVILVWVTGEALFAGWRHGE